MKVFFDAVVHSNEDPRGLYRLQVKCPELFADKPSDWAKPMGVFAGKGYGIFLLPQKGDNVKVWLNNGDARFPCWGYGDIAESDLPPEAKQNRKGIAVIAPKGNKFILLDNGKITISNGQITLGECLSDLFQALQNAKVATSVGVFGFDPTTLGIFEQLENKFKTLLD